MVHSIYHFNHIGLSCFFLFCFFKQGGELVHCQRDVRRILLMEAMTDCLVRLEIMMIDDDRRVPRPLDDK